MFISSKNCCIQIVSQSINNNLLRQDILTNPLLFRFIPDLTFNKKINKIILRVENKPAIKVNFSLNRPFLYGRYLKDFNSTDIIVISEYLLEYLRQEDGICVIHSSAVYKKNRAILFIANLTGAGKTSLALYLHAQHQYQLFSDEKTLIDIKKIKLVGQTKKLFIEPRTKNDLKYFGLKLPKIINIQETTDKNLALIVMPIIVSSAKTPFVYQYSPTQLRWRLYEEFSKDIRLVNGLIFNFSYPLQSLDNDQLAKQRECFIEKMSRQIPCYCIVGTLEDITKKINQIFSKIRRKP